MSLGQKVLKMGGVKQIPTKRNILTFYHMVLCVLYCIRYPTAYNCVCIVVSPDLIAINALDLIRILMIFPTRVSDLFCSVPFA